MDFTDIPTQMTDDECRAAYLKIREDVFGAPVDCLVPGFIWCVRQGWAGNGRAGGNSKDVTLTKILFKLIRSSTMFDLPVLTDRGITQVFNFLPVDWQKELSAALAERGLDERMAS